MNKSEQLIACLEGEIAKRDEELAACRVAVENCEVFRARIAEFEAKYLELASLSSRISVELPIAYALPVSEAKAQGVVMPEPDFWLDNGATPCYYAEPLRALLSAQSPAGVDGLEVIGWYTDDHLDDKSATTYSRKVADRWLAKGWPITGIANAADAQAIIDGLRGEVGAQRVKTCTALKERNDAREERDQQAQRIGELEGLLREWRRMFDGGLASGQLGVLRGQTDAAIYAGKEGE